MKYLIGQKQNMTQIFGEDGKVFPATLVKVLPMKVVQVKSKEKDGYTGLQFGFGVKKDKNINKAQKGHSKGLGNFMGFKELRTEEVLNQGDSIDSSSFILGDNVTVTATSKGKGFQGVVKRHGFKGGPRSHGQKHSEREPGSIGGAGRDGGRVAKGKRMAGRMGGETVTVKGLSILKVLPESSEILIKGSIPGRRGTIVEIKG